MTTDIGAIIFLNYLFNLERTSLSLIVFEFRKATLSSDGEALWSLGDFRICLWALCRISCTWFSARWNVRTSVMLSSTFLSRFWNKTVLSTNFTLSISESTWSSLRPRVTNHYFNCSRWLLSFSSVEQIFLIFTACPYAIDITVTWLCISIPVGLQYFVTVTFKKLISVVE